MPRRLLLVLAVAACVHDAGPLGPEVTSRVQRFDYQVVQAARIDLLFVIDNSPAMAPHRERLRANFAPFMQVLATLQGGLPSLHLGVVTTDGRLRTSARVDGAFISDLRYESPLRVRNYTGELADVFAELADVGSDGDVYTRPLDAIRLALDHPANAGFLRADSYLAVVVISATDDCSFAPSFPLLPTTSPAIAAARCHAYRDELLDVTAAAAALMARRSDPSRVAAAAIIGPDGPPALRLGGGGALEIGPSCSDEVGGATAAPRLHAFLEQFPHRSTSTSLCQPNLADALALFSGPFHLPSGGACVDAPLLDVDPARDGVQAECSAAYWFPDGAQRVIPSCGRGEGVDLVDRAPCWSIQDDTTQCPIRQRQRFAVTPSTEELPLGTRVIADCVDES